MVKGHVVTKIDAGRSKRIKEWMIMEIISDRMLYRIGCMIKYNGMFK